MPTKSKPKTGTYTVANPRHIAKGVRIFVCVNDCGEEFYEGDTIDLTKHGHLSPERLIRDGFIHG